jgi:hypothetical protein
MGALFSVEIGVASQVFHSQVREVFRLEPCEGECGSFNPLR